MLVEELLHDVFEIDHATPPQLGVANAYPQGVSEGLGLYFEDAAFFDGEEDVGEHSFGGDSEVAQSAATQPAHGAQPGDEVAGFAGTGKLRRELFFARRSIHAVRVTLRKVASGTLVYSEKAPGRKPGRQVFVSTFDAIEPPTADRR
jgi:hypothetical protein